ncbi:MAG TPA: PepSY domain-containing protein [Sphingomonas sp.]
MRAYHRWFGIVAALFMIFIAATGLALQIDLIVTGNPVPGAEPPAPPAAADPPAPAVAGQIVSRAITATRRANPRLAIDHADITFAQAGPRVTLGGAGPFAPAVSYDAATGKMTPIRQLEPGWHNWLQNLHAGYVFGPIGRAVSIAMAVSLLLLGVTGLLIYLDMFRRRRRAGRHSFFWRR